VTFTAEEIAERGHPVWAEIDLAAFRHNIETLSAIARPAQLMAVVKGYAYGHGNPQCAQDALEAGATRLGVARVAEAFHLRESGITAPIHVFTEPPPEAAKTIVEHALTATVYTQEFAEELGRAAVQEGTSVPVHVKLDTGMHRVGLSPDDALDAISRMRNVDGISIEGAWTHLAVADVPDHPFTHKQLDLFDDLVGKIEAGGTPLAFKHVANSAATLSLAEAKYDLVRCGVACYGLWPGEQLVGAADLRPVMSLKARINMVKRVPAGEGLSYGLSYELDRPGQVVTVPAGYADGYDRRLSGTGDVLIEGKRYRVSGTVCMDQFMVDVGSSEFASGSVATLLGSDGAERVTAEELATLVGTINYEVTARIPSRVPRVYLNTE
jgi:alanine racemase